MFFLYVGQRMGMQDPVSLCILGGEKLLHLVSQDDLALGSDNGLHQDILQLPHISGPRMGHQQIDDPLLQLEDLLAQIKIDFVQKVIHQLRNIRDPLP